MPGKARELRGFATLVRRHLSQLEASLGRARKAYPETKEAFRVLQQKVHVETDGMSAQIQNMINPQSSRWSCHGPPWSCQHIVWSPRRVIWKYSDGFWLYGHPAGLKVNREVPESPTSSIKKRKFVESSRRHYHKARRETKKSENLENKLKEMTDTKEKENNRISEEWIVRVFLSQPCGSGRGLAQSFKDVAGSDITTLGRSSIGRVRNARVELYKPMVLKQCADLVATERRRAATTGAPFAAIFFLHVQDEAR